MDWSSPVIILCLTAAVIAQTPQSRIINNSEDRQPVWSQDDLQELEVFENLPLGREVDTLSARDPEGQKLTYTISGDYFSADSDTGKLTLIKELDREELSEINVVITVQDGRNIVPANRKIKGKTFYCLKQIRSVCREAESTPG